MNRGRLITLAELNQLAAECYSAIPLSDPPPDPPGGGITGIYEVAGGEVTWRPWPPVPPVPEAA